LDVGGVRLEVNARALTAKYAEYAKKDLVISIHPNRRATIQFPIAIYSASSAVFAAKVFLRTAA
jgi:hypothetical protein